MPVVSALVRVGTLINLLLARTLRKILRMVASPLLLCTYKQLSLFLDDVHVIAQLT